jgi:hypothetical protein
MAADGGEDAVVVAGLEEVLAGVVVLVVAVRVGGLT